MILMWIMATKRTPFGGRCGFTILTICKNEEFLWTLLGDWVDYRLSLMVDTINGHSDLHMFVPFFFANNLVQST